MTMECTKRKSHTFIHYTIHSRDWRMNGPEWGPKERIPQKEYLTLQVFKSKFLEVKDVGNVQEEDQEDGGLRGEDWKEDEPAAVEPAPPTHKHVAIHF